MHPQGTGPHGAPPPSPARAPTPARLLAGLRDDARQDRVSEQALGLVQLAGVDIGLAGVSRGVDEKFGPVPLEAHAKRLAVGVVHLEAAQAPVGYCLEPEQRLVGVSDVSRAS